MLASAHVRKDALRLSRFLATPVLAVALGLALAGHGTAAQAATTAYPDPPTGLSYAQGTIAATVGQAVATDLPTVTGTVTTYTAAPALPAGLSLNGATGAISGTPGATAAAAGYTIYASNQAGYATTTVVISAAAAYPVPPTGLAYAQAAISATVATAIKADLPSVTGTVTTYTIVPALPAGLSLDSATGAISGTPSAAAAAASYTVYASNQAGYASAVVSVAVNAPVPAPTASVPGFLGLFQDFPSSSLYASARTAAAMAANPWMKGGRFWVDTEDICQDTVLPLAGWNADASSVTGFTGPMSSVLVRMTADPDASWNIQGAGSAAAMDAAVAGFDSVGEAARTTS